MLLLKSVAISMSLAALLFEANAQAIHLENELCEALERILPTDSFEDLATDGYDSSLELWDCPDGFALTEEHQLAIWELGFDRCWLLYKSARLGGNAKNGERYYRKTGALG